MNKNEFNDVIMWVDGSADNKNRLNPKSGCSCWFGDNWYCSQRIPFTDFPEMAGILTDMTCTQNEINNQCLSSTQM